MNTRPNISCFIYLNAIVLKTLKPLNRNKCFPSPYDQTSVLLLFIVLIFYFRGSNVVCVPQIWKAWMFKLLTRREGSTLKYQHVWNASWFKFELFFVRLDGLSLRSHFVLGLIKDLFIDKKLCASLSDTKVHMFMLMIIVDRDFPIIGTYANR